MAQHTLVFKNKYISGDTQSQTFESTIGVGEGSLVLSLSQDLKILSNEYSDNKLFVEYIPIPNKRIIHGFVRVFDKSNNGCFEDVEVYINQKNGIWCDSGTYFNSTICCNEDKDEENNKEESTPEDENAKPYTVLENVSFTTNEWIKKIKVFVFDNKLNVTVDNKEGEEFDIKNGKFSLTLKSDNSVNLTEFPIMIYGYCSDEKGEDCLLGGTIIYLTVTTYKKCEAEVSNCILQVSPSKIVVPHDMFKKYDELKASTLKFTVKGYINDVANPELKTSVDGEEIMTSAVTEGQLFSFDYPLSGFVSKDEFDNTKIEETTSGTKIDKKITFTLGNTLDNCAKETNLIVYNEIYLDETIRITEEPESKLGLDKIFFWDENNEPKKDDKTEEEIESEGEGTENKDEDDKTEGEDLTNEHEDWHPDKNTWKYQQYNEDLEIELTSMGECYIYQSDSSIVSCNIKKGGTSGRYILTIKLIDYNAISWREPLEIILQNSYGNTQTIQIAVDKGLVKEDIYSMYWKDWYNYYQGMRYTINGKPDEYIAEKSSNSGVTAYYLYYAENQEPIILHSEVSLVINDSKPMYGDWIFYAFCKTDNPSYTIRRYVEVEVEGVVEKKWEEIQQYKTETPSIDEETDSANFDIQVWINENPLENQNKDNVKVGDIWISSNKTFLKTTECWIDFYQELSDSTYVRLYLRHDPVLVYRIYTDQQGEVMIQKYDKDKEENGNP